MEKKFVKVDKKCQKWSFLAKTGFEGGTLNNSTNMYGHEISYQGLKVEVETLVETFKQRLKLSSLTLLGPPN